MIRTLFIAISVLALAGCQSKLKDSRTLIVEPAGINTVYIDGPKYDQKVTVEFSSSECPVSVFVCLKQNEQSVGAAADVGQLHADLLGSVQKATSGTIDLSIPAKQDFAVLVMEAKKRTTVTLKLTGK